MNTVNANNVERLIRLLEEFLDRLVEDEVEIHAKSWVRVAQSRFDVQVWPHLHWALLVLTTST